MDIRCNFTSMPWCGRSMYTASIKNQDLSQNVPLRFNGAHSQGKTNANVTAIRFEHCILNRIPKGLRKTFQNLRALQIQATNLKTVEKGDLAEYRNFTDLVFNQNLIEFLPGDLFEGFNCLEVIDFYGNELKRVDFNILNGLDKLTHVHFSRNPLYEICYSKAKPQDSNGTLNEIKIELRDVYLLNYQLTDEIVSEATKKLEIENQKLKTDLQDLKNKPQTYGASKIQTFFQQDNSFKDFRIKIAEREFLVHKLLLAARSPTLAEMLRDNPEADCLNLVDIPVGIFEQILDFLYTDKLPIGMGSSSESDQGTNFVHLFAAAGRLKIEELKNHAAVMIGEHIGAENALEVLKMSNKYGHDGLRMKAFEEIKRKYPKVEFKDEWMENYEKIERIIEGFLALEEAIRVADEEFKKLLEMD